MGGSRICICVGSFCSVMSLIMRWSVPCRTSRAALTTATVTLQCGMAAGRLEVKWGPLPSDREYFEKKGWWLNKM